MRSLFERTTTGTNGEGASESATHPTFSSPHHTSPPGVGALLKVPSVGGGAERQRSRSTGVVGSAFKTPLKSPLVQGGTFFSSNVAPQRGMKNSYESVRKRVTARPFLRLAKRLRGMSSRRILSRDRQGVLAVPTPADRLARRGPLADGDKIFLTPWVLLERGPISTSRDLRTSLRPASQVDAGFQVRRLYADGLGRAEIHNNLGLVLMQMKDSKAEVAFKEALRLKPDYAEAHYNLALALLQTGKKEESNSEFEKAYQLAPHLRVTGKPNSSQTAPKN